jgi:hypothetical protein
MPQATVAPWQRPRTAIPFINSNHASIAERAAATVPLTTPTSDNERPPGPVASRHALGRTLDRVSLA